MGRRYIYLIVVTFAVAASVLIWELAARPPAPLATPTPTSATSTFPIALLQGRSSSTQPKITWTPTSIEVILAPGESTSKDFTFTSDRDIQNIVIQAVPEIAEYLTIQPNSFAAVSASEPQSVRLNFLIPATSSFGTFDGTIHVRLGAQTLPQTLKVTLDVWQPVENTNLGVKLAIPPTMTANQETDALGESLYVSEVNEEFPNGITIRKHNRDLQAVLNDITISLRVVSQTQLTFNGQTWLVYTFANDRDGLQFNDAFTVFNGIVYQVGGLANTTVNQTLPKLLSTFKFL